ncbi:MAG: hypothetical protein AB1861_14190, partial [Cyanobacteriota bacterium]
KKLAQNHWKETAKTIPGLKTVLAVGDTTYLDYKKIIEKREEYGPIGMAAMDCSCTVPWQ